MRLITLDFETHYGQGYTLTSMTPLEYVMDERYETISCAIKVDHHPTDVFFGHSAVASALQRLAPIAKDGLVLAHNMLGFDAYVLAYRFGFRPRMWGCTMAMARPIHAKTTGLGLARLVQHYAAELKAMGIAPVKDNTALVQTRGKRLEDFTPAEIEAMRVYNRNDTDQCWGLFRLLRKHHTAAELWQIDALTRMRVEPAFTLDAPMLEVAASMEATRKHSALLDLARMLKLEDTPWDDEDAVVSLVKSELASAPKFSRILTDLGVEVPMKVSPTDEDKLIPALAKTDVGLQELQEHENPVVAAAARARLDVKSTLLETRIQKFLTAGRLAGGRLPVPLRYCGADTTGRDSGEEYNCQNLPRIIHGAPRPSDALRNSLGAGKGKLVIVADQSGIELRVNHFLWKVPESMAMYQASPDKADLYKAFAAAMYGIDQSEVDKGQRQTGKVAQLGLGFGSGAATFRIIAKTMGGISLKLGVPDPETGEMEEVAPGELTSTDIVRAWRAQYADIVQGWKTCGQAMTWINQGMERAVDPWGLVHTSKEGFVLPSGRIIRYPDLREEEDGQWPDGRPRRSWFYAHGRHKARITGPKADENCVQALSRDSVFDCALDFYKDTGLRSALRVHDELVYVVDEGPAGELLDHLQSNMRTPPKWWPELVVWSEGSTAKTYGGAK